MYPPIYWSSDGLNNIIYEELQGVRTQSKAGWCRDFYSEYKCCSRLAVFRQTLRRFPWHEISVGMEGDSGGLIGIYSCINLQERRLVKIIKKHVWLVLRPNCSRALTSDDYLVAVISVRHSHDPVEVVLTNYSHWDVLEHRHIFRRPTIFVFLDIKVAHDSVGRAILLHCLSLKGVPGKFTSFLQPSFASNQSQVHVYGDLSFSFAMLDHVC